MATEKNEEKLKKRRGPPRSGRPWRKIMSIPGPMVAQVEEMLRAYRLEKLENEITKIKAVQNG